MYIFLLLISIGLDWIYLLQKYFYLPNSFFHAKCFTFMGNYENQSRMHVKCIFSGGNGAGVDDCRTGAFVPSLRLWTGADWVLRQQSCFVERGP